ncbi:hypothetical protein SLS60_005329 [Paraconiothyrium brasiliense]|uniref:DNA2/NAM7 helicase-like C-terminal domain-containing protein n=1 Tax=Paraconiothyrium brasiliense TaxID=300254 RepID=A0ABR3RH17_9PLEO
MSKFNELGIDIGQVAQLAHTKLTRINGRTALWSFEEREQEEVVATDSEASDSEASDSEASDKDEENEEADKVKVLHKRSYYGNVKLGPAQRSEFNEKRFPVAAAFLFKEHDEKLPGCHVVSAFQLNIPDITMTDAELKQFKHRIELERKMPDQPRALPNPTDKFVPSYRAAMDDGNDLSPTLQMKGQGHTAEFDADDHIVWSHKYNNAIDTLKFKYKSAIDTLKFNDDMLVPPVVSSSVTKTRGSRARSRSVDAYRPEHIEELRRGGSGTQDLHNSAMNFIAEKLHLLGKEPYDPSDTEILARAHLIVAVNAETYQSLSRQTLPYIRNRMRLVLGWKISLARLQNVLLRKHSVFSVGNIPVSSAQLDATDLAEQRNMVTLPSRNRKREQQDQWTTEEKKAHFDIVKARRKRLAAPKPNVFEMIANAGKVKQEENTFVKFILREDPNERSYMRLRVTCQYTDPARPQEQPRHQVDIDLTYRNTRPHGNVPDAENDVYVPSERIFNVSNRSNIPLLMTLFPHLTRDNPRYWDQCYASLQAGHRLTLIQFYHNELPSTSNLFTEKEDMPLAYNNLREIMHKSPVIYLLVRGTDVDLLTQSMINRFVDLAGFNPMSRFFQEISNPSLNHSGVRPTEELPKFVTLPEYSFEDWDEASARFGIGGLIELRFGMRKQVHRGKASVHPIPHTQSFDLDMGLLVNFSEEYVDGEIPKMTVGDHVKVDFGNPDDLTASEHAWKGRVVPPTVSTAIGQVCIIIHRPHKKNEGLLDRDRRTTLSVQDIEAMSSEDLQNWTRQNCKQVVTVFKDNDSKECKRLMNGLAYMVVPYKSLRIFRGKEHILAQLRTMLMCNDHQRYDKSSLYSSVHEEDIQAFVALLPELLKDYQMVPVSDWQEDGLRTNTAILGGISGSGKTHVSTTVSCGYLFRNRVDSERRNMQLHEYSRWTQNPDIAPPVSDDEEDRNGDNEMAADATGDWQDDTPADATGGWKDDTPADATGGWQEDTPADATGGWKDDTPADATGGWKDDTPAGATDGCQEDTTAGRDGTVDDSGLTPEVDRAQSSRASPRASPSRPLSRASSRGLNDGSDEEPIYENGRVTHCCIQNETVDHSYETFVRILTNICARLEIPMKLVVRCHSIESERRAFVAMMDPAFELDAGGDPTFYKPNPALRGTSNFTILEHYLRHFRTQHPGIADKRFRAVQGSVAWIVLQLAQAPGFEVTELVRTTWSEEELDSIADELRPIIIAMRDIDTTGEMNKETKKAVKIAFKNGFRHVIARAPVVCTTASVANSSGFQIIRRAVAVCLEEAGRATDLEFLGFLSNYWDVDFRLFVGDQRQLGPQPYGDQKDNPFYTQYQTSTLARLRFTGFPFHELAYTSRFTNPALLHLCQKLNDATEICEVAGAFDTEKEDQAKGINTRIWGIRNVIAVLNTEDVVPLRDPTGSYYCVNTALTTMHDLLHRLRHISGDHVLVITPYNAQVRVLLAFQSAAVSNAIRAGENRLAKQISKVAILTVDSAMGKDAPFVILDTVGHDKGFFWRQPRTIVAGTRARNGLTIVGPTYVYTSSKNIDSSNRLKEMLHQWGPQRNVIVTVAKHKIATFEQYLQVQKALDISIADIGTPTRDLRFAPLAIALQPEDYSDEEESVNYNEALQARLRELKGTSLDQTGKKAAPAATTHHARASKHKGKAKAIGISNDNDVPDVHSHKGKGKAKAIGILNDNDLPANTGEEGQQLTQAMKMSQEQSDDQYDIQLYYAKQLSLREKNKSLIHASSSSTSANTSGRQDDELSLREKKNKSLILALSSSTNANTPGRQDDELSLHKGNTIAPPRFGSSSNANTPGRQDDQDHKSGVEHVVSIVEGLKGNPYAKDSGFADTCLHLVEALHNGRKYGGLMERCDELQTEDFEGVHQIAATMLLPTAVTTKIYYLVDKSRSDFQKLCDITFICHQVPSLSLSWIDLVQRLDHDNPDVIIAQLKKDLEVAADDASSKKE